MDFESNPFASSAPASKVTIYTSAQSQEAQSADYVYNTPDAFEEDPEILRAELLFFSNPQSQLHASEAYFALQNVQDQCAADFSKLCESSDTMMTMAETQNFLAKLFAPGMPFLLGRRRLNEAAEQKITGRQLLEYMRSFYVPQASRAASATETVQPALSAKAVESAPLTKKNLEKLQDSLSKSSELKPAPVARSHVMRSNKRVQMKDLLPVANGPITHRTLRMEPNRGMTPREAPKQKKQDEKEPHMHPEHDHDHDHDRHSDHDGDHHSDYGDHHGPPPPKDGPRDHPPSRLPDSRPMDEDEDETGSVDSVSTGGWSSLGDDALEDTYFPGAMGFGAAGDLCMYKNVESLSPPCMQAVGDLYAVREAYWESYTASQQSPHHGGGAFFVLIIGVLLGMLIKKIMFMRRAKPFREFFHALNDRPEIKAELEQKLGVAMPKLPHCKHGLAQRSGSFCANFCIALMILLGTFFVSLIISITSLEMTAAIVTKMEEDSNEPASPTAIILILLTICVAQTALFVAAVKGVKCLYRRYFSSATNVNVEPSAPPSDGGAPVPQSYSAVSPLTWYTTYVSPRVNAVGQIFQRRAQPDGYMALSPNGEDDREMIPVGTHTRTNGTGPSYAIYTGIPVNTGSTMVAVPVTARPVSMV